MTFIPAARQFEDRSWPEDLAAAKALFMTEVAHIIGEGRGDIRGLESGILELRLATGEIYHLGERSITRIV
jgi:putative component of toxin-antitoxin plasmid stabilization module